MKPKLTLAAILFEEFPIGSGRVFPFIGEPKELITMEIKEAAEKTVSDHFAERPLSPLSISS